MSRAHSGNPEPVAVRRHARNNSPRASSTLSRCSALSLLGFVCPETHLLTLDAAYTVFRLSCSCVIPDATRNLSRASENGVRGIFHTLPASCGICATSVESEGVSAGCEHGHLRTLSDTDQNLRPPGCPARRVQEQADSHVPRGRDPGRQRSLLA